MDMASATLISVNEYLSTSYRPDCDYVDGELMERNVGEWDHSRLQGLLYGFLLGLESGLGILAVPEQRVQVKPTRYRVPDLCVVSTSAPREQILTHPPLLYIEILSKDDTMTAMYERIGDYLEFGVQCVWVVDPRTRRGWIFTSEGMREAAGGVLEIADPAIRVRLADLFQSMTEPKRQLPSM
jgi:Uma2 family endonuclease